MIQLIEPRKKPSVDMIGTYRVDEPVQKMNPKDGLSYEVPPGDYPVMGMLSEDGKRVNAAAVILSALHPHSALLMDIVETVRPIDVPAMVQRREIALETTRDNTLKFPLAMFIGEDAPQKKQAQAQAPAIEHRLSIARSA